MDIENDFDNNLILSEINIGSSFKNIIKQHFDQIMEIYDNYSKLNKNEIKFEIDKKKDNIENNIIYIIASMIRVVELEFYFKVRDIQIISLLICLLEQNKNGLIEEIKTGEGKTIIIAFLAVIFCLKGKKVDILNKFFCFS